ncbi:hypothetical protein B7P43_G03024, partial [Cryptotermes secundus]
MQKNISDMAEAITLSKTDDQPWGFRVTGGLDFGTPVTVIKVTANSLAEQAGLKVGDMLLQANGQPLSFLTHHEYTKFLIEAGNFIELVIVRGSLVLAPPLASLEPTAKEGTEINHLEDKQNVDKTDDISNSKPLPASEPSLFESIFGPLDVQEDMKNTENVIQELNDQPSHQLETTMDDQTQNEEKVTLVLPESAAEDTDMTMPLQPGAESQPLSQEQEVKEQSEETATEEVKRELSEEEISDIMVGRAEVLTGTTIGVDFDKLEPKADVIEKSQVLQLLKEEENEPEKKKLTTFLQVPNRPKIKPKEKPKEAKEPPKQPEPQTENKINQEVTENGEEEQITESDQPNTEQDIKEPQLTDKEQSEENELPEEQKEKNEINAETVENPQIEEPEKANEDKLLEIQSQLTALLQLPVVMQQQLSFIQQQLTNIVQQKIAEINPVSTAEDTDAEKEEGVKETEEERAETEAQQEELQDGEEKETADEEEKVPDINQTAEGDKVIEAETDESATVKENQEKEPQNVETDSAETTEETPKEERKRDIKWQKERPKKNKPFFPLTPHPRPIVLPGRIKFQMNPEEAYDDDFIAETLSGNAEVIKGTTIGVNFQKYQRSYDHLKSSSVYRMIHETEKRCPGAFEGRPEKILALEDYKQVLQASSEVEEFCD